MKQQTITVYSSNGELIVDKITGQVLACEIGENGDKRLEDIRFFDLAEWKEYHEGIELPTRLDILDLGYWHSTYFLVAKILCRNKFRDGKHYEPPAMDWREMMIDLGGFETPAD